MSENEMSSGEQTFCVIFGLSIIVVLLIVFLA